MEARPAYAALRGDFYTHAMDLPPQLSPFGLSQSAEARRLALILTLTLTLTLTPTLTLTLTQR